MLEGMYLDIIMLQTLASEADDYNTISLFIPTEPLLEDQD